MRDQSSHGQKDSQSFIFIISVSQNINVSIVFILYKKILVKDLRRFSTLSISLFLTILPDEALYQKRIKSICKALKSTCPNLLYIV